MSHSLPPDWYEEHDGQRLVLSSEKVAAELGLLRDALVSCASWIRDGHICDCVAGDKCTCGRADILCEVDAVIAKSRIR